MREAPKYRYDRLKWEKKHYLIIKQNVNGGPWTLLGTEGFTSAQAALNRVRLLNEGKKK